MIVESKKLDFKRLLCSEIAEQYAEYIRKTGENIPELSRAICEIAKNIQKQEKQNYVASKIETRQ